MQYPHYVREAILLIWFLLFLTFLIFQSSFLQAGIWYIVSGWWWVLLPLTFILPMWQTWVRYWDLHFAKRVYDKMIFLRITLAPDMEQTPRGMEHVFYNIHGMTRSYIRWSDRVFFRERPSWISCEMVAIGNSFSFIVGVERTRRSFIEAQLYSQYPDIRIEEVADYTQTIPPEAPNEDWQMWGVHYVLQEPDVWMIRTYKSWELEKESEAKRKADPISHLAELSASLKPGEQVWIQLLISPLVPGRWREKAQAYRRTFDKPQTEKPDAFSQVSQGVGDFLGLFAGKEPVPEKEEQQPRYYVSTMEKVAIEVLGLKIEAPHYQTNLRAIYWGPREVFDRSRTSAINGFVRSYDDWTGNWFRMERRTRIRNRHFPHLFVEKRLQRKRKSMLWYYKTRYLSGGFGFMFNTTELASLFHFPGPEVAAPALRRLPFRKGKPPMDLPTV